MVCVWSVYLLRFLCAGTSVWYNLSLTNLLAMVAGAFRRLRDHDCLSQLNATNGVDLDPRGCLALLQRHGTSQNGLLQTCVV